VAYFFGGHPVYRVTQYKKVPDDIVLKPATAARFFRQTCTFLYVYQIYTSFNEIW